MGKITMFATVIALIIVILAIGVFKTSYAPEGFFIIRVILAVVAAGFAAAFIPGILQLFLGYKSAKIRAGGAAAVFVMIYLLNPPSFVKTKKEPAVPFQSLVVTNAPQVRVPHWLRASWFRRIIESQTGLSISSDERSEAMVLTLSERGSNDRTRRGCRG